MLKWNGISAMSYILVVLRRSYVIDMMEMAGVVYSNAASKSCTTRWDAGIELTKTNEMQPASTATSPFILQLRSLQLIGLKWLQRQATIFVDSRLYYFTFYKVSVRN